MGIRRFFKRRKLIKQLKSPDYNDRASAAVTLGNLKDPKGVPALIEALRHDGEPDVQWKAARALGDIGDDRAVGPLIGALSSTDKFIRHNAVKALIEFGDVAVPALIEALKGEHPPIWRAVLTLGAIFNEKAEGDLSQVQVMLKELVAEIKKEGDTVKSVNIQRSAARVYKQIAEDTAKRKRSQMRGKMLPPDFKPRKKPRIYRKMRRAVA